MSRKSEREAGILTELLGEKGIQGGCSALPKPTLNRDPRVGVGLNMGMKIKSLEDVHHFGFHSGQKNVASLVSNLLKGRQKNAPTRRANVTGFSHVENNFLFSRF